MDTVQIENVVKTIHRYNVTAASKTDGITIELLRFGFTIPSSNKLELLMIVMVTDKLYIKDAIYDVVGRFFINIELNKEKVLTTNTPTFFYLDDVACEGLGTVKLYDQSVKDITLTKEFYDTGEALSKEAAIQYIQNHTGEVFTDISVSIELESIKEAEETRYV